MLYNPAKGQPSTEGFASWLGQQNPDQPYTYNNSCICAISQYLTSIGVGYLEYMRQQPDTLVRWNLLIAGPTPHTFGAAADRARKYREYLREVV